MLTHLTAYHQYIDFLISSLCYRDKYEYRFLDDDFSKALFKMVQLDVDSIIPLLATKYSHTGRPAKNQIEILRSFILMAHFRYSSISKWCDKLHQDPLLAILIGCPPYHSPASSNHYDFMARFFPEDKRSHILPAHLQKKNKAKPKKNEKLENVAPGVIRNLVDSLDSSYENDNDSFIQSLFFNLAVKSSINNGLIDTSNNSVINGDGTALPIHSNPSGTKICDCQKPCDCHRRYSDIDADIGWDSDLGSFYFGYSGYTITTRNHKYKLDLPVFLTLAKASQHDSITSVTAFHEFSKLNNNLIPISHYCLDSASDNYATHEYLLSKGITPIIDINKRMNSRNVYSKHQGISENGNPICVANLEMKSNGYDYKRYRHKFRCPYLNNSHLCPCKEKCSSSPYGRVVYIKTSDDIKLFGPVPYHSKEWYQIYKDRSSCERINNRIINDYSLSNITLKGRNRNLFMMLMIGANIHLDALYKVTSL